MSPSLTSISIWLFQPPSPSLIFLCPWGHWRCTYSFSSWPSLTFPALISILTLFLSQPSSYGHCLQPGPFPAPLFSAFPISRTFNSHLCLKEPLDEGERGEWKSWLKTQHSENEDYGIWSHHFMANRWKQWQALFSWAPKPLQTVAAVMKLKDACSLKERLWPI